MPWLVADEEVIIDRAQDDDPITVRDAFGLKVDLHTKPPRVVWGEVLGAHEYRLQRRKRGELHVASYRRRRIRAPDAPRIPRGTSRFKRQSSPNHADS